MNNRSHKFNWISFLLGVCLIIGSSTAFAQLRIFTTYEGTYSSTFAYSINDIVSISGTFYISLVGNNTGNTPAISPTDWLPMGDPAGAAALAQQNAETYTSAIAGSLLNQNTTGQAGTVATIAGLVTAGNNVTLTGLGTLASPFTIGVAGSVGATGATGATGPTGSAATVAIGTTTTGSIGSQAIVTNSGTSSAAVFNFTIPPGATGATGATGNTGTAGSTGAQGTAATIAVGTVTPLSAGSTPTVTNAGTSGAAIFNFGIPAGATGATGSTGSTGTAGTAATIAVGSVTTGAAGSSATIVNAGTTSAAVFNFSIPQGATGAQGTAGTNGAAGPNQVTTATTTTFTSLLKGNGSTVAQAVAGTDYVLPSGSITGQAGTVATISGLISAGTNITITGSGTSASPYVLTGAAGGSGSGVTAFTVNNGITASVAGTTATLGLAAITPTSVAASGTVSGTSVTANGTANGAELYNYTGTTPTAPTTNQWEIALNTAITTPWIYVPAGAPSTGVLYGTLTGSSVQQSFTTSPALTHVVGTAAAIPTIAPGTGSGTSPTVVTVQAASTDLSGYINITTGTSPTAAGPVATITFNIPYTIAPKCSIEGSNAAAMALTAARPYIAPANTTTAHFVVTANATALTASTAYQWGYTCTQ